jgi:beta-glucosidase
MRSSLLLAACLLAAAEAAADAAAEDRLLMAELVAAKAKVAEIQLKLNDRKRSGLLGRGSSQQPSEAAVQERVDALIGRMTVTEKATQLDIWRTADMLSNGRVNMTKAKAAWGASALSAGCGVMHDVYPYPEIYNEMMTALLAASRLKIPPLFGGEATHGLQMDSHTIFPSPISLAATFDTSLMAAYGRTVGAEARACGTTVTWAPVLGLCQEPRCVVTACTPTPRQAYSLGV